MANYFMARIISRAALFAAVTVAMYVGQRVTWPGWAVIAGMAGAGVGLGVFGATLHAASTRPDGELPVVDLFLRVVAWVVLIGVAGALLLRLPIVGVAMCAILAQSAAPVIWAWSAPWRARLRMERSAPVLTSAAVRRSRQVTAR